MCKVLHLREFSWSVQFSGVKSVDDASDSWRRGFSRTKIAVGSPRWTVWRWNPAFFAAWFLLTICASSVFAENCRIASDLDDATRTALNTAGLRYFDLIAKGDTTSLRQSAIPILAADFSSIEATIKDNQPALTGVKANLRPPFLLEADGTAPLPHAEFYCGVFGSNGQTRDSAVFSLNNLAPGKYAVVILDVPSSKGAFIVSLVLQQQGSDWKLGGLYIKAGQSAGHDSDWFVARAREFQSKGQMHNAWLYFLMARSLISPLPFMSTAATDKLYDESQKLQPADFPADGKTVDLSVGASTPAAPAGTPAVPAVYKLSELFPQAVGDDLDLIVRYQAADVSNTQLAYQSNVAVMKAVVAKYPELRTAFTAVIARAVDPSGRDYGTLLSMKDIK